MPGEKALFFGDKWRMSDYTSKTGGEKMSARVKICFAVLFALGVFASSEAGVVITAEVSEGVLQKWYISGDSLRYDIKDAEGHVAVIFTKRAGEKVLIMINTEEKAYTEMTSETVKEIKDRIEEARKMMEQTLQHLPEAQREEIKSRMQQQFGAPPERKVELEQSSVRVNNWVCDKYAVYLDGKKSSFVWLAESRQFGLDPGDLGVLKDFAKFLEPLGSTDDFEWMGMFADISAEGIPVKITEIGEAGRESSAFTVNEVKKQAIAASVFEIPPGFRRMDGPFGGG